MDLLWLLISKPAITNNCWYWYKDSAILMTSKKQQFAEEQVEREYTGNTLKIEFGKPPKHHALKSKQSKKCGVYVAYEIIQRTLDAEFGLSATYMNSDEVFDIRSIIVLVTSSSLIRT
jgi:hypothetical protein